MREMTAPSAILQGPRIGRREAFPTDREGLGHRGLAPRFPVLPSRPPFRVLAAPGLSLARVLHGYPSSCVVIPPSSVHRSAFQPLGLPEPDHASHTRDGTLQDGIQGNDREPADIRPVAPHPSGKDRPGAYPPRIFPAKYGPCGVLRTVVSAPDSLPPGSVPFAFASDSS